METNTTKTTKQNPTIEEYYPHVDEEGSVIYTFKKPQDEEYIV